ncbi:LruC domain-containing protein [Mucilaginibacter ginkgonis]|uniref:LruC domain-containing protein n=1 Tax=Mucilaginibacter ginkgonis TaxID=2682091 RepID=A0A6I4I4H3_9SPHI|nr:LruC domain-containing protein [Mucilaginibacter ginkgonis]QQL48906.1 LruC domain-containing protein [Mucilaginibacter ginkgonis]
MKRLITCLLAITVFTISCKKDNNSVTPPIPTTGTKIAPDGFTFSTSNTVSLSLTLLDNSDNPLKGVVVSVYPASGAAAGTALFKGVTNQQGVLTGKIVVPAYFTQLIIDPSYIGLLHNAVANINNGSVTATIGGRAGYSGDIVPASINNSPSLTTNSTRQVNGLLGADYIYPTGYTSSTAFASPTNQGKPAYLEATGDNVPASLLSYINASLPENVAVTTNHPEYISSSAVHTLNVTAKSDVYVTFVSEGADYQNTLAYYTYNTSNPPSSAGGGTLLGGIDKITYVFPNASGYGSGGGLKSGDKVKLGNFAAGTTIAFVLIQNGWTGSGVNTNATKFYSQDSFNPESSSSLRQHNVCLYDNVHNLFVLGFEDLNRQNGGSDNDFNDLVIYATTNPTGGISATGVAAIDNGGDTDGDGVIDALDAYPNDPTRAYVVYYPSASTYATLAFEDNYPSKGDYDMNDLVLNYRYTFTSNAQNQFVDMKGEFNVVAAGASFKNGFGVQLPVPAAAVSSVTGQKQVSNYITFAANGVEAGQTNAVIIPFDNFDAVIKNQDNSFFINTLTNKDKVTGTPVNVAVTFAYPITATNVSINSINPFLISNLKRGYEVHLPGYLPTDKADKTLFGTADDNSSVAASRYYLSKENWPWAISFSQAFTYPLETIPINQAYPHFTDWAASGGTTYTDWYSNTSSGFRNTSNLYTK